MHEHGLNHLFIIHKLTKQCDAKTEGSGVDVGNSWLTAMLSHNLWRQLGVQSLMGLPEETPHNTASGP